MPSGVYGSAFATWCWWNSLLARWRFYVGLWCHITTPSLHVCICQWIFLPRDAMLSQYLLLSRVCLSVGPSQAGIRSKRLDESNWFSARRLLSTCPTLCYEEIRVSPQIRELPSGTLSQTLDFRHFKSILSTKVDRRRSTMRITSMPVYVSWLVALSLLHVGRL